MRVLITAGPTREPIDPVRFLTNRSSGKMGYALARAFQRAGHGVLLVSGPTSLDVPEGVDFTQVLTAADMHAAVRDAIHRMDIAVFAAAVADYTPREPSARKIKKSGESLTLELVRTPDILGSARGEFGFQGTLVGFAAETEDLEHNARDKLLRKQCDLVIANDVSQPGLGFDADRNQVLMVFPDHSQALPAADKDELARRLVPVILDLRGGPHRSVEPASFLTDGPRPATPRLTMTDLELAIFAALEAGKLLRAHFGSEVVVDEAAHHDIKLALDRQSQDLITGILLGARPGDALYGEEGVAGQAGAEREWIVDPIDGTVNYFYAIPHFCVSIALRVAGEITVGVIHDPMVGETWTVERGGAPLLNGRPVAVSNRDKLEDSILFIGCGKDEAALATGIERFRRASLRARKMRMMGSAALGMAYVASGRLDAYIESRISLWDIAAGKLLVEAAGGTVELTPLPNKPDTWSIVTHNGRIPVHEVL